MRYALLALCVGVSALLQARWPLDAVLVLTLSAGLSLGPVAGALCGFGGGLLLGAGCGNLEGPMALVYLLAGWAAGELPPTGRLLRAGFLGSVAVLVAQYLIVGGLVGGVTAHLPHGWPLRLVVQTAMLWPVTWALSWSRPVQVKVRSDMGAQAWRYRAKWGLE